jgi:hypothetical protein
MQGFKNFSRTARELVNRMQKIDSDYYLEVIILFEGVLCCWDFCLVIQSSKML